MTIITKRGRTFRRMEPVQYSGNDREFLIDCPFEEGTGRCNNWSVIPKDGCENVDFKYVYMPVAQWKAASPGAAIVMRGEIEADLTGFALLRVRFLAAKNQTVRVRAEIDGALVDVAGSASGADGYAEYTGPIAGKHLSAVEVQCEAGEASPTTNNSIMWVMLVKPGEPTPIEKPDPAWSGLLREDDPSDPRPSFGLFFNVGEMDNLRRFIHDPEWAEYWAEAIADAERFAKEIPVPEATANPVIPVGKGGSGRPDSPDNYRYRDVKRLALVGLLEKRTDFMQLAARWALTWTRCERWVQNGIENLKGVTFHHGRFVQSYTAETSALVLDWCGSVLTEAGQTEIARAIHDLGILDIDGIMFPGSYVWTCNQGVIYEFGRFLGAYAVRKWYPAEYARRQQDARCMLNECLNATFYPDGTGKEGTLYWGHTIECAIRIILALSRASGRSIAEETPGVVAPSAHWAFVNLSTDSKQPRLLTYGDCRGVGGIGTLMAAFFAGPLKISEYYQMAHRQEKSLDSVGDLPLYYLCRKHFPKSEKRPPTLPPLTVFADSGQVDIRQSDPRSGMRIYFLSGNRYWHGHDDKNSFILESFGKTLLIDRITLDYTHPEIDVCKSSAAHNTVAPNGISQSVQPEKGGATLLKAEESSQFVIVESDAAGCWPGLGKKVLRRLIHLRPSTLLVEDVVEWARPVATQQYWQSLSEWHEKNGEWITTVDSIELSIMVLLGEGSSVTAAPFSVDGRFRPVHRLVVETPSAKTARIITLFRVRPDSSIRWDCVPAFDAQNETLRLEQTGGQVHTITMSRR